MYDLARLRIEGPKACQFLQGQLSCDVNKLAIKEVVWSAYCSRQGKVMASGWLCRHDVDAYHWIIARSLASKIQQNLHHYAQFSRQAILQDEAYFCLNDTASSQQDGYRLDETNTLTPSVESDPSAPWMRRLIQQGLTLITHETSEKFTPHMLNFQNTKAISFTKGCFLGQEIIARTQHLGESKRHTRILSLPESSDTLATLLDSQQKTVGKITSQTPCAPFLATAVVSRQHTGPYQLMPSLVEVTEIK